MPITKSKFSSLVFIVSLFFFVQTVSAVDNPQTQSSSVTATVPSTAVDASDTTAPTNPILIRPIDGTYTGDNRPEFVWSQSTDPNSNNVVYTHYLDGVATYLGVSNLGNSASSNFTARIEDGQIKLLPLVALADGSHNWYVTAEDLASNKSYSTTWSFVIDTVAPLIILTDVSSYHDLILDSDHPELFTDLSFDIAGPTDVRFTLQSEPWSTLTIQYFDSDGQLVHQSSWPLDNTGLAYPYYHLEPALYTVSISSFDRGGNTTALPNFSLNITQAQIIISLPVSPGSTPAPLISIPYAPISLSSLPATISHIQTRLSLLNLIIILLAIILILLLIFISRKRYNLILLDPAFAFVEQVTIYHSIPGHRATIHHLSANDHGRCYIPHLGRYSTLTLRLANSTYILSLSAKRATYTIVLG